MRPSVICYLVQPPSSQVNYSGFFGSWKTDTFNYILRVRETNKKSRYMEKFKQFVQTTILYLNWFSFILTEISQKFGFSIENSRQKTLCGISINNINQTGANCDNQGSSSFRF